MEQPYTPETIAAALRARHLDVSLRYFARIGSTNDEAMRLLSAGAPEWTVVVADEQSAGRGRMGRCWVAPPGTAVLMSVALRPQIDPARLNRLTMLGAVATLRALRRWFAPETVSLKWPNDVLLRGASGEAGLQWRKVAGVLPEAVFMGEAFIGAALGIGLNVNTDFSADPELMGRAISMVEARGSLPPAAPFDRAEVLAELLVRLWEAYPALERDELFDAWRGALTMLGEHVIVTKPGGLLAGVAESVDADGALWLRTDAGERVRLLAGDVTLAAEA